LQYPDRGRAARPAGDADQLDLCCGISRVSRAQVLARQQTACERLALLREKVGAAGTTSLSLTRETLQSHLNRITRMTHTYRGKRCHTRPRCSLKVHN
jgi:hypothetical protein